MTLNFPNQNLGELDLTGHPFLNAVIHEPLRTDAGAESKRGWGPRFTSASDRLIADDCEGKLILQYLNAWVRYRLYGDRGAAPNSHGMNEIVGEERPLRADENNKLVDPLVSHEARTYLVVNPAWAIARYQWKFFIFPESIRLYSRWQRQVSGDRVLFNLSMRLWVPIHTFYCERFERADEIVTSYSRWREFLSIRDTPGWKTQWPQGPVRFDVRCDLHGTEFLALTPEQLPGCPETFHALLTCCYPKP